MIYRALSLLICALACSVAAFAQNSRSAVSVAGNDANTCVVSSPCRSFAKAITVTNAGGEIIALDSGGYGPFVIDRAISVRPAPGAYAGITVTSGDGIDVSAGSSDDVILRGITVNGLGGNVGIYYLNGHSLVLENCAVDGMSNVGIVTVVRDRLFLSHTTVTGCGSSGIQVGNGGSTIYATIVNSSVDNNGNGVSVYQGGNVTIANSTLSNNMDGLTVYAPNAATDANAVVESSTISGNSLGISTSATAGTATVRVSNCTITHNITGIASSGSGQNLSRSNNTLRINGTNGAFDGTFAAD